MFLTDSVSGRPSQLTATVPSLPQPHSSTSTAPSDSTIERDRDGFQTPKHTVKGSKRKHKTDSLVKFQNIYSSLEPDENIDKQKKSRPETASDTHPSTVKKTSPTEPKPAPLYIYGISNKYNLIKIVPAICHLLLVSTHSKDKLKIQTFTMADFDKISSYCLQYHIQFATEQRKRERPFKKVIRKLPVDSLTADIKQELTNLGFPVLTVT